MNLYHFLSARNTITDNVHRRLKISASDDLDDEPYADP